MAEEAAPRNNILRDPVLNLGNLGNFGGRQIPELKNEYLKMIPEFTGEVHLLPRFIGICEKLIARFYDRQNVDNFQNDFLMSSILSKITGKAQIQISNCRIDNWQELKEALLQTYSDKRKASTLTIEMTQMRQIQSESSFDFFQRIQNHLYLQHSYLDTHHADAANANRVIKEYLNEVGLQTLLNGLREPLNHYMKTRDPRSMNEALSLLTNDFQHESTRRNNAQANNNNNMQRQNFNQNARPQTSNNNQKFIPRNNNQTYAVAQRPPYNGNANNNQQQNRPNQNQNYQNLRPNQNNYQNFQRPAQNNQQQRPTGSNNVPTNRPVPMSVCTANVYRQPQNFNIEREPVVRRDETVQDMYAATPVPIEEALTPDNSLSLAYDSDGNFTEPEIYLDNAEEDPSTFFLIEASDIQP